MVTQEIATDNLVQFTKKYDSDPCSLELLLFLRRHPYTRFSHLAIVHALDACKFDVERAIIHLEEKGLLKSHTESGVSFYSLM